MIRYRENDFSDVRASETTERNKRVQARYDELMREGKHGHYETIFRIVREEIERANGLPTWEDVRGIMK